MYPVISGLNVEDLEGGAIVAYTLSSAQTRTISAWSELAVSKLKQWPKDRPYLALHDLSNPGVGLLYMTAVEFDPFNVGVTSSGHHAVRELLEANTGWPIVLALVVSTSLSGRLTRLRITDNPHDKSVITSRAFFKRSAAVEWLMRHAKSPEKIALGVTSVPAGSTITVNKLDISTVPSPITVVPPIVTVAAAPVIATQTLVEPTLSNSQKAKPTS
jgi:hypothetical protein